MRTYFADAQLTGAFYAPQTKQLVELRDRLKEFQEIANTYGSFKDLALQLGTILKASTAAQETIGAYCYAFSRQAHSSQQPSTHSSEL